MGDIAEMMLDGTLCAGCGIYMGEDAGFPCYCHSCEKDRAADAKAARAQANREMTDRQKKAKCVICGRRVKIVGMKDHMRDAHGEP